MTRDQGSPGGGVPHFLNKKLEMRNGGAAHKIRSAAEYRWRCPKEGGITGFPFLFPDIVRLTANNKDFSLRSK